MQTNKNHRVSGQELDNLLKQAFLNLDVTHPKYDAMMETVAHTTFTPPVSPVGGAGKSFFTAKMILFGIGLAALISLIALFFIMSPGKKQKTSPGVYSFDSAISSTTTAETDHVSSPETPLNTASGSVSPSSEVQQPVPEAIPEKPLPSLSSPEKHLPVTKPLAVETQNPDSSYVFPVLTEEEVEANEKRKEKMLIQSIKLSASKYAFIPQTYIRSPYFYSKGVFNAQYMQKTEVSNIEYKTFLFDLLMRNDRAGFLKAKPDQSLWNTIYDQKLGKYFEDVYFSDKAYNDYPVVNVSREGAELYCKWLKEESEYLAGEKDLLKEEELQALFNRSYSLPTANDWAYAAEAGKLENDYPWEGSYMRNSKGAYLANFCIQKEKEKPGTSSTHYTSAGVGLGPGEEMLSCRVDAFKPNAFRLYNMSGNAAELVLDDSTGQLITKGGSWNSSQEELKISSREAVKGNGASPYHGFRPVINLHYFATGFFYRDGDSAVVNVGFRPMAHSSVYMSREKPSVVYKDTAFVFSKFSGKEIAQGLALKEKMIKDLLALRKEKYALIPMGSCSYQSETVSTYAFYMQTTEVSNAEYKAFLIDLYVKGKQDEFRKCLPDQKQWTEKFKEGFTDPMKYLYFGHEAYNNYPVVNVSRYGAEAYCQWLSTELSIRTSPTDKKQIHDIRLPSDMEWAMAASSKHNQVKYASGTDSLVYRGKYVSNYSCVGYATAHYDSLNDFYRVKISKGGPGFMSDEEFFTGPVNSYAANLYGIYNLAGNVSEMVYLWDGATNKAKGFGTKGGSWISPDYFLEIGATQEFKHPEKPSPFVGFRPVITAVTVDKTKP